MESGKKPLFNGKELTDQWPEFRGEKKVSIGDNWVCATVVTYYHVYNDFCKPGCIEADLDLFIVDHLCESIDNN